MKIGKTTPIRATPNGLVEKSKILVLEYILYDVPVSLAPVHIQGKS